MLYPNSVTVPVMTNYGQPPEPKGMLYVRVIRMEGFENQDLIGKQDPYVTLEVRHAGAGCGGLHLMGTWVTGGGGVQTGCSSHYCSKYVADHQLLMTVSTRAGA
jgi:hypothetical protein